MHFSHGLSIYRSYTLGDGSTCVLAGVICTVFDTTYSTFAGLLLVSPAINSALQEELHHELQSGVYAQRRAGTSSSSMHILLHIVLAGVGYRWYQVDLWHMPQGKYNPADDL